MNRALAVNQEVFDPMEALDIAVAEIEGDVDPVWKIDPIPFLDFVASKEHMNHPELSERQRKAAMEFLGMEPKKLFEESSRFTIAVLLWGKGSGKDLLASLIHCYATYVLQCMKNPQVYFGWPETEYIDVVNVAYSADQASGVYFVKFKEKVKQWVWLRENFCIYQEGRNTTPSNVGKPVVKIYNSGYIEFPHHIRAVSESSENESYEGYNIIFWIMDEASAFRNKGLKANSQKIYETLRTSASSRFGKRWKGMILSWPRQEVNDFTIKMYETSLTEPSIYGDYGYTWQVKPGRFYCGHYFEFEGEQVPIELEDDFRLEPEMSKAKYMCKPQKVQGAFFTYSSRIQECVGKREPLFDVEDILVEHEIVNEAGDTTERRQFVGKRVSVFRGKALDLSLPRVAHIDAGLVSDAAGLVVAHGEPIGIKVLDEHSGEYQMVTANKVIIDAVVRWVPDKRRHLQVSINNIEALLVDLIQQYGIKFKKITYDQWNSQSSLEMLMAHRIAAEMHTINAKDYGELRTMIYSGAADMLSYKIQNETDPNWMIVYELEHLINFGSRVDHPENGSKDLADCFAGVNRLLNEPTQKQEVFRKMPHGLTSYIGQRANAPFGPAHMQVMGQEFLEQMPGMKVSPTHQSVGIDRLIEPTIGEQKKSLVYQPGRSLPRGISVGRGSTNGMRVNHVPLHLLKK